MKNGKNNERDSSVNNKEKRAYERYMVDALGEVVFTHSVIEGIVTNICFGGFYIKSDKVSPDYVGEEVKIRITTKLNSESYSIEGKSRVVRCDDEGMGLFFIDMENENIAMLNKLILNLSLQESEAGNKINN